MGLNLLFDFMEADAIASKFGCTIGKTDLRDIHLSESINLIRNNQVIETFANIGECLEKMKEIIHLSDCDCDDYKTNKQNKFIKRSISKLNKMYSKQFGKK